MKKLVVLLAACSSSPSPTKTPAPPPPDAAIDAQAIDAPPAIDPALTGAPASIFRFHSVGSAKRLETWTLRTADEQGMIVVERMAADGDAWKPASTSQYVGGAANDGKTITLALVAGTDKLSLACTPDKVDAAAATAVRKLHPKGKYKACGDPGRWVPEKTKSIAVLRCMHPDFASPMLFAEAPGVEYLFVSDDRNRGGGYRVIAADGAIAPAR